VKVKIGNTVYDSEDQPIMVILTREDKKLISQMYDNCMKYCAFPDEMEPKEIEDWMKDA